MNKKRRVWIKPIKHTSTRESKWILLDTVLVQHFWTGSDTLIYSQNGQRVPSELRSLGFKLPKIPSKICIIKEIREAIFQLSVGHSIFHLEFLSVVDVVAQTLFIMLLKIWEVTRKERNYILITFLQELKELGWYEYFFQGS